MLLVQWVYSTTGPGGTRVFESILTYAHVIPMSPDQRALSFTAEWEKRIGWKPEADKKHLCK